VDLARAVIADARMQSRPSPHVLSILSCPRSARWSQQPVWVSRTIAETLRMAYAKRRKTCAVPTGKREHLGRWSESWNSPSWYRERVTLADSGTCNVLVCRAAQVCFLPIAWPQPKPFPPALNFCPCGAHPLSESQPSKHKKECLEPLQSQACIFDAGKCLGYRLKLD
jgi:hypothetical protein